MPHNSLGRLQLHKVGNFDKIEYMSEISNSLIRRAKELEDQGNFWEAGEEYKNALLEFNKEGSNKDEKALCKKKIREMNLRKANDFKQISVQHDLSAEEITRLNEYISSFIDVDVKESLKRIGRQSQFCPQYTQIVEASKRNMPISFMIANLSSQDEQGNFQRDGHDGYAASYTQNYGIHQSLISNMYLVPIFQKLIETKLSFETLSDYFKSTKLFSDNMLKILDVGLERFNSHDYVSSMHILAPLFEKTFIDMTDAIGGADIVGARTQTGSPDQVWTQERTLGEDFLKNEKVREIWGESFCEQILFTMFAPLGYKLRHKIAHGYMTASEFNFANNTLILYFFLVIAARVTKTTQKNPPE